MARISTGGGSSAVVVGDKVRAQRPPVLDPHGRHLNDALVVLRGLAEFARGPGGAFDRIEAVADGSSGLALKALDPKNPVIRDAVLEGPGQAVDFSDADFAVEYDPEKSLGHVRK